MPKQLWARSTMREVFLDLSASVLDPGSVGRVDLARTLGEDAFQGIHVLAEVPGLRRNDGGPDSEHIVAAEQALFFFE